MSEQKQASLRLLHGKSQPHVNSSQSDKYLIKSGIFTVSRFEYVYQVLEAALPEFLLPPCQAHSSQ